MARIDETGAQRVALGVAASGGVVTPVDASNPLPFQMIQSAGVPVVASNYPATDGWTPGSLAPALATGAFGMIFNGASWDRQRGDASGIFVNSCVFWTEATANQAISATLNGTLRASGGVAAGIGSRFEWFVAEVFSDQAGTLYIDKSVDGGTTWRQVGSIAAVAATSVSLRVPISAASYRARFVNGAVATTAFLLTSGFQT